MDVRKIIAGLATSQLVADGTRAVAGQIQRRASQIDPDGRFEIEKTEVKVRGLTRTAWRVTNTAPDAGDSEFGDEGRPAKRPLGRAARAFKG